MVLYTLPKGVTSQTHTLRTWLIGNDTKPDRPATITPAEQRVSAGDSVEATVSWRNLEADQAYLGLVEYGDGTRFVGITPVAVTC